MMISLISEQTIPNILAILHFRPENLLFVSTEKMQSQNKVEAILRTLKRRDVDYSTNDYQTVVVNQDSIKDCMDKLQDWAKEINLHDFEIIVNLTGGTKMMAIGAYEVFKDYSCQMIYIPIPKNEFIVPHPPKSLAPPTKLGFRLNVIEYLMASGLCVLNEERAEEQGQKAIKRFKKTEFIYKHYLELKDLLKFLCSRLRSLERSNVKKLKKGKVINFEEIYDYELNEREKGFLKNLEFNIIPKNGSYKISCSLSYDLYKYITGGWLEEYVYKILCGLKEEGITDVQIGLHLKSPKGTENEFDVMFTYENALYFVECKSLDQEHDKEQDILYKTGALQTEFGLRVEAFLATQSERVLDRDGNIKPHLIQRAKQMKTTILPLLKIKDLKGAFREQIRL